MIESFFSKSDMVILFYNYQNTSFVHFMEYYITIVVTRHSCSHGLTHTRSPVAMLGTVR